MKFIIEQLKDFWLNLPMAVKIIIIAIILIYLYYLIKKYGTWFKKKLQSSEIDYKDGETPNNAGYNVGAGNVEAGRQKLEDLANQFWSDIYQTSILTGHNVLPYTIALTLSDNDLRYVADHYDKYLTKGTSLYSDMDSEIYPFSFGDLDSKLMAKLSKIGKQ